MKSALARCALFMCKKPAFIRVSAADTYSFFFVKVLTYFAENVILVRKRKKERECSHVYKRDVECVRRVSCFYGNGS